MSSPCLYFPGTRLTALLIISAVLVSGCLNESDAKPAWVHNVNWIGEKPGSAADIENALWTQIAPYNTEYDLVNISVQGEGSRIRLRVMGLSNAIQYPDIYDFTYSDGILTRTGYLLEAISPHDRDAAIVAAMQSRDVIESGASGIPTVRRILPDTSRNYYASRTLLSVTWAGVSALIDPQEWKVVKVWKAGGQEGSGKVKAGS